MQALQDVRALPGDLLWSSRIPNQDAMDGEITARMVGRVLIADLIADNAKANVYASGKFTTETTNVPNIKIGRNLTQETLNQLLRLGGQGMQVEGDSEFLGNYIRQMADDILQGIRQRAEQLRVLMLLEGASGVAYDRYGIKLSGVSWGMPSDLNITVANAWTDVSNGTPVNDLFSAQFVARTRYGINLTRATMSTPAFRNMIATTEFQNKARMYLAPNVSFTNLVTTNITMMRTLAENVTGFTIEFNDGRFWIQDADDAEQTLVPYQPLNKVILTDPGNDGKAGVWDFANAVVTESVVGQFLPNNGAGIIGRIPAGRRGPIGYTSVPVDMNPPQLTMWGVQRGFPRKHKVQANAVLSVGTITDQIPVTDPWFTGVAG
jgi:hypothetical protein